MSLPRTTIPLIVVVLGVGGCVDLARPEHRDANAQISVDAPAVGETPNSREGGMSGDGGNGFGGAGGGSDGLGGTVAEAGSGGVSGGADAPPALDVDDAVATDVALEVAFDVPTALGLGAPCTSAGQCTSNFCVEGVCCDSGCTGICQSCAGSQSRGTCHGATAGTDPRDSCPDDGVASCDRNGLCDVNQRCQRYAAGAVCVPMTCANNRFTSMRCDGNGSCSTTYIQICSGGCSTGVCRN